MKKILVYSNRKVDDLYVDASTPELFQKAVLYIFDIIREWGCYDELEQPTELKELEEYVDTVAKAKQILADAKVSEDLLRSHSERVDHDSQEIKRIKRQQVLYTKARAGDAKAAWTLLMERADYEYENVRQATVEDPLDEK